MIKFIKYTPWYVAFSLSIFAILVGGFIYKRATRGYAFIYSVDYTGGTQVLFKFSKPMHSEEVAKILEKNGLQGVVSRNFAADEVLVRVSEHKGDSKGLAENMKEMLEKGVPGLHADLRQIDSVGASTGESLWIKSLQAILLGLLLMLLYTWWRFWSLAFGIGVWVSLFHDAIVILGFFMLFDYEISSGVIAALMMILGYSINDTIVIFSRVRENIIKLKNVPMSEILDISFNETLRRTMLTSFATMLVIVALLIFGGHTLRGLSVALLVGIVFGTYSSIAVASPVMLWLYKGKNN